MEQPGFEFIRSGEFSAAAVAQYNPDLYADVTDILTIVDPQQVQDISDSVLDHRQVNIMRVIEALDDVFGHLPSPYADEDDDQPSGSLADQVELFLREGGE